MKLAAIYNVWDGDELLEGSIRMIYDHVDRIIIVDQIVSNYGEMYAPTIPEDRLGKAKIHRVRYNRTNATPMMNEKAKRNLGIQAAKDLNCTHFILMDCDEYYPNFGVAKQKYIDSGKEGSVCKMMTYFKRPTLCFENPDNYLVPFIHRLHPDTECGTKNYPFYVDPTRTVNTNDVVELPILMHHFSWVRNDINRKIRNSSAKKNIENSSLLADYLSPEVGPGYFVRDFGQRLMEVPNIFSIADY